MKKIAVFLAGYQPPRFSLGSNVCSVFNLLGTIVKAHIQMIQVCTYAFQETEIQLKKSS